jgi:hypothetical protein
MRRYTDGNYNIWYCTRKHKCKWQAFAMCQGLAWGVIPDKSNKWRQWHDRECDGKLIQVHHEPKE